MTPKTLEGRMMTIVYCIIGLPLTLMCLAKMGHAFATAFRVIYHTCCCAICCLACIMRRQNGKNKVVKDPGSDMNDALSALVIGQEERKTVTAYTPLQLWKRNIGTKFNQSLDRNTAVPTYLCLLVMAAYIAGGAWLFSAFEDTWTPLEGAYFCFITLTTIGFGDFVPGVDKYGRDKNRDSSAESLVLCALYLLVGLALIGMCIDLMQVDVVKKFKWAGRKIGISKPKHGKTQCDAKKERVGLKLSCEALQETIHSPGFDRVPITRSVSHSLEVPSPTSIHSMTSRRSTSVPNTPNTPAKSLTFRPFESNFTPLATSEELEPFYTEPNSITYAKNNGKTIPKEKAHA